MIKLAMIKIQPQLEKENLQSKMILQVHDELVFDALPEELDILKPLILNGMKTALPLPNDVPVEAELGMGNNWMHIRHYNFRFISLKNRSIANLIVIYKSKGNAKFSLKILSLLFYKIILLKH